MINKSYRLFQALFVFFSVILWVFFILGVIEYFRWQVFPGIFIHVGIVIIALVHAVFIIGFVNIEALANLLFLKKTSWRYYLVAVLWAFFIWVADFWIQIFYFLDNGKIDSLALQSEMKKFGAFNVVVASCLLAPVAEEILFRGILLRGLLEKLNPIGAILISSLVFAGIHFSIQDFLSLLLVSIGYGFLTIKAKSILPPILAHLINNSVTIYYFSTL